MSNVNWDTYARHYDTISSLVPYSEMISLVAATIEREHGSLLDASCGTGNLEAELMLWPQNSDLSITGVDISPVMLKRATEKLPRYRNLRFNQADLNRPLFFESGSFGQVACINTLYAVHNPEFVLDEFHRVLAPGGKIVIVSPKKGFENGLILKAHAKSTLPDDFWARGHESKNREEILIREAVKDEELITALLYIAEVNRGISKSKTFHFFTKDELVSLIELSQFKIQSASMTYADQAHIVVATK